MSSINNVDSLCHLKLVGITVDQENRYPVIIFKEQGKDKHIFPLFIDPFSFQYLIDISEDTLFKKRFLVDIVYEQATVTGIFLEIKDEKMIAYYEILDIESREISLLDALAFVVRYQVPVFVDREFVTPLLVREYLFQGEKNQLEYFYKKAGGFNSYQH